MDLTYVKKLIKLLSDSDVDELEIEEEGKRIRIAKSRPAVPPGALSVPYQVFAPPQGQAPPMPAVTPSAPAEKPSAAAPPQQFHEIKSPIVGTFYRAPAPDAPAFVQVGSVVDPGTVLCIVEAMKLMNEIESDVQGRIVQIMVENGQPVEYDQTLFLVEKP